MRVGKWEVIGRKKSRIMGGGSGIAVTGGFCVFFNLNFE